jgi:hypothetical protein
MEKITNPPTLLLQGPNGLARVCTEGGLQVPQSGVDDLRVAKMIEKIGGGGAEISQKGRHKKNISEL